MSDEVEAEVLPVDEVKEGDIVRPGVDVDAPAILVEKITDEDEIIGHELGKLTKAAGQKYRVLNRDFRYKHGIENEILNEGVEGDE